VTIYFYPDVIQKIFGIPANELTDTCVDMSLFPEAKKMRLVDRLLDASAAQRISIMEDFVLQLISSSNASIDAQIRYAANQLSRTHGGTRIVDIQKLLNISERTLHRRFEQHVGVVPKVFANIVRFRSAFDALETGKFEKLSDLAFEFGYADQSHFIRAFKSFTGQTPRELRR
jgi:AraC-like DNA-binding protein